MQYSKNYLRIYLWQGISFILNFLSMFIVVPFLTSVQNIYGIYAVCISITIFLSYADMGFIGAGQKYAAEYFARGDRENEIKTIGFSNFILLLFLLLFVAGFLCLGFNPHLLINNLVKGEETKVASSLLLILALFTPVTLLQRLAQMIFGIRLEDYIIQRVNIFGSLLKIASVLFFLSHGKYHIVGYFLFTQIVNLVVAIVILIIAKKRYCYNFTLLLKSLWFNREIFAKTKGLAFTSLYLTITWILYYELDSVVISKFLGVEKVAIYAIGLTIMSFFRTIYAVIFAPFGARFNHFVGLNDEDGLHLMHKNISKLFAPVVIIPVLTVCLMAKPLIVSWVGIEYSTSVELSRFLVLCFVYGFITYPASLLLIAKEKTRELNLVATLIPLVYWLGIMITFKTLGVTAFAIFKFIAFSISAVIYLVITRQYLSLKLSSIINEFIKPNILSIIFLCVACFFAVQYLPEGKSKINLLSAALTSGIIMGIAFLIVYYSSQQFKQNLNKLVIRREA